MAAEQPPAASGSSEDRDGRPEDELSGSDGPIPGEEPDAAAGDAAAGDAAAKRTLCRSSTDKVIAGVAGGIGAYFGIDSVILRIAFIVLTFLGGAGPFLYLIGWLALPKENSRSVIVKALGGDSPHRLRSLVAVVLIGIGLLITANLSGELFKTFVNVWTIAPFLALVLVAAGVALVLWPGPTGRSKPTPAPPPPPAPSPPAPPPSTSAAGGPKWAAASPTEPAPTPVAPVRRQGRTTIGYLTVAVLLAYTGSAVILDRLDVVEVDIGVYFAVALAITGVGLLASAYAVPARGLILLGVVFSAPLLLFVGAELPWGSGVGEVRVTVATAHELQDEYRHGVGQMVVDLRHLDPENTDHSVDLSLSVGEMLVYVPDNISTTADIDVGAGNIRVWYGGPAPDRIRDLDDVRDLIEGLWLLTCCGEEDDFEDLVEAYERDHGRRIAPEQRQSLSRLLAGSRGGEIRVTLKRLRDEARGVGYPWEDSEDGLGIARTVTVPVWGEHEGELRLDIDVGVGEAEVVTVQAPFTAGEAGP
ncbi:MAG: PspC domain-containing protein [Acidimicrobiia bacterium]|nr:PspC domain-containing protein [Acidimicrobiia bacterium]